MDIRCCKVGESHELASADYRFGWVFRIPLAWRYLCAAQVGGIGRAWRMTVRVVVEQ